MLGRGIMLTDLNPRDLPGDHRVGLYVTTSLGISRSLFMGMIFIFDQGFDGVLVNKVQTQVRIKANQHITKS